MKFLINLMIVSLMTFGVFGGAMRRESMMMDESMDDSSSMGTGSYGGNGGYGAGNQEKSYAAPTPKAYEAPAPSYAKPVSY